MQRVPREDDVCEQEVKLHVRAATILQQHAPQLLDVYEVRSLSCCDSVCMHALRGYHSERESTSWQALHI